MFELKRKPNTHSNQGQAASPTGRDSGHSCEGTLRETPAVPIQASAQIAARRQRIGAPVVTRPASDGKAMQTKLPVLTGEAQCRGMLHLDGVVSGQLGGCGGSLGVRQRSKSFFNEPEFSGEITFRDMVRVNGHIAGTVYSQKGTLIVDLGATLDANVDVAVAVIGGTVTGDIVAHERVEIGPGAKIYGNIWTRSIEIKNGAIFEGVCTMIAEEQIAG